MGAMGCLDSNDKALVFRSAISRRIVPDWKIFKVFISYIGVLSVLGVRKNLFFLLFKLSNVHVKLCFDFQ